MVNNFTGGKAEDTYRAQPSECFSCIHIDSTKKGRLRSQRDVEDATPSTGVVTAIVNMQTVSDGRLLGLGRATTTQYARILERTSPTAAWAQPSNNTSGSAGVSGEMFVEYYGYMYFWTGNGVVSRWKMDGSAFEYNWYSTGVTSFTNSVGYSMLQNNFLYIAQDNVLYGTQYNNGTGTVPAPVAQLRFPPEYKIVSIDLWDNYLAIGLQHKTKFNASYVAFWDKISPKPSFIKKIPDGKLFMIRNINGELAAFSLYSNSAGGSSLVTQETILMASTYSGLEFNNRKLLTLAYKDISVDINESTGVVKNNFVYFGLTSDSDDVYTGVYRFGFDSSRYVLVEDRFVTNNDPDVQPEAIQDLEFYGDVLFASYNDNGTGTNKVSKTVDGRTFSSASKVYTSQNFVIGKRIDNKKIESAWIATAPLTGEPEYTGEQKIYMYWRANNESTWNLVGFHDAALYSDTLFSSITGDIILPTDVTNIEFRFEFIGLVQMIEYGFNYSTVSNKLHATN
jgi:hypothetical protein